MSLKYEPASVPQHISVVTVRRIRVMKRPTMPVRKVRITGSEEGTTKHDLRTFT